jgi:V/A-type H+-transporting ATPase subunit D
MSGRTHIAPTRSNLLRTRESLELAREGYEILDKKREVLSTELVHVAHDAERLDAQLRELLAAAYDALDLAKMTMGREHIEWAALAVNKTIEVRIRPRSVMGVLIPMIESEGEAPETPYGLGDTTVALDEAASRFGEVLSRIPSLSEAVTAAWRLARELQKTQRRVNALEHIFIPEYETTVAYIESVLEEREREETFRLKRLKSRMAPAMVGPPTREYVQPYRDISGEKRSVYRDTGGGRVSSREFG